MVKKINKKKQRRRLIILGVVSYLIFLLVNLPASFLVDQVLSSTKTARLVKLNQVQGSVWSGQALDASIGAINLGILNWDLSPWGFLLGDIDVDLKFNQDETQGSGQLSIGFGGKLAVNALKLEFPAEIIQTAIALPFVSLSGLVTTDIDNAEYMQDETFHVEGKVLWQDAVLRMPNLVELGDIAILMSPFNQGTRIKINDKGNGPITINVTVDVYANGRYKMNGTLTPKDASQQHITEVLKFIGRPDNSGAYHIGYNGSFAKRR